MELNIFDHFLNGGFFMWLILGFLLATIGLCIERGNALYLKLKIEEEGFRKKILGLLSQGDLKGAEELSKKSADTSVGRIAALGCHLKASAVGEEELQSRMDEELSSEISRIDKRTGFLAMLGNVAMLLGLLGTVTGMIISFAAIANASPVDRATLLSKGIAQAMNTTAFGLMVAIPALVAYAVFQNRVERVIQQLTESTSKIYHDLIFVTQKG